MDNILNTKIDRMEQTNEKILGVLKSINSEITGIKGEITGIKGEITGINGEITGIKGEITEIKNEMSYFRAETNERFAKVDTRFAGMQEQFEFMIEHAATKQELQEVEQRLMMALNIKTSTISDRFDTKLAELKHDIVAAVRGADKKFLKFAI